ncbi:carbohydrate ABC transporter permease [Streptomyces rugosispiralis]|uniref:Carbohydrate ABC transporter permease n=1 Tax=Streptomyces rugosispiralis TaxID=2967341 RepID=A0ABT1V5Q5_9ACTN|nr:carbohydrate ABC transporter permease [Streptomyces rugosispiralis]MCQ8192621.1 carbohydrate ABC transporter permease [Streptomyces rugosispiralis]
MSLIIDEGPRQTSERPPKDTEPFSRLVSPHDRRRRVVRIGLRITEIVVLLLLIAFCAGPILWMLKAAVSPSSDIVARPLSLWPSENRFGNLGEALSGLEIGRYLLNSVYLAGGCLVVQLIVSTSAGFALSVLKPRYGKVMYAMILATLLVPATVSLVPLYLTAQRMPGLGVNLINSFWAIWLPAGANAFNVLLVKRFFDGIPAELYEAARVDGAGPLTLLWRIVLPMSRPVLAVVSLFTLIAAWKEFLWPLIALTDPQKQPIAVALPTIAKTSDQGLLIAGLLLASVPPLLLFIAFQRQVVNGVGGDTGSKG